MSLDMQERLVQDFPGHRFEFPRELPTDPLLCERKEIWVDGKKLNILLNEEVTAQIQARFGSSAVEEMYAFIAERVRESLT